MENNSGTILRGELRFHAGGLLGPLEFYQLESEFSGLYLRIFTIIAMWRQENDNLV